MALTTRHKRGSGSENEIGSDLMFSRPFSLTEQQQHNVKGVSSTLKLRQQGRLTAERTRAPARRDAALSLSGICAANLGRIPRSQQSDDPLFVLLYLPSARVFHSDTLNTGVFGDWVTAEKWSS